MPDTLITIARYASPEHAGLVRAQLEAGGVSTFLEGETTVGTLAIGTALGDVRLQVAAEDADRARELIAGIGVETGVEAWTCPNCGAAVDSGFELCWSCGTTIDGERPPDGDSPPEASDEAPVECPMCGALAAPGKDECAACGERLADSAESSSDDRFSDEPSAAARTLRRAWKAAVLGTFLIPPLVSLYSLWQLARFWNERDSAGSDDNWRFKAALLLNVVMTVAWTLFWFGTFAFTNELPPGPEAVDPLIPAGDVPVYDSGPSS